MKRYSIFAVIVLVVFCFLNPVSSYGEEKNIQDIHAIDIRTDELCNLLYDGEDNKFKMDLRRFSPGEGYELYYRIINTFTDEQELEKKTKIPAEKPGNIMYLPLEVKKYGAFQIDIEVFLNDKLVGKGATRYSLTEPASSLSADSPFGCLVSSAPVYKRLGISWIRLGLDWRHIEPEEGKFVWDRYDREIENNRQHGIEVLGLLSHTPGWAWTTQEGWPRELKDINDYCEYVTKTVTRYKGKIKYWEVENEQEAGSNRPNQSTLETYMEMLKNAYRIIKEVDPENKVQLAGGSPHHFVEKVLNLGGGDYFDIYPEHLYASRARFWEEQGTEYKLKKAHDDSREIFKRYGVKWKEWWNNEDGATTSIYESHIGEGAPGHDLVSQAQYLVIHAVASLSLGAEKFFWYQLASIGYTISDEQSFGLIWSHPWGKNPKGFEGTPKPSAPAYINLINRLNGKKYQEIYPLGKSGKGVIFRGGGKPVMVCWDSEKEEAAIPTGAETVTIFDIMGNRYQKKTDNGILRLTIGRNPQYIEGLSPQFFDLLASIKISPKELSCYFGEEKEISVRCRNPFSDETLIKIIAEAPTGWEIIPKEKTIRFDKKDQEEEVSFKLRTPMHTLDVGKHELKVKFSLGKGEIEKKIVVDLKPALQVLALPLCWEGSNTLKLGTILANNSKQNSRGALEIVARTDTLRISPSNAQYSLQPGAYSRLNFALSGDFSGMSPQDTYIINLRPEEGLKITITEKMDFQPCPRRKTETIIVDGTLGEWQKNTLINLQAKKPEMLVTYPGVKYEGDGDLSGRIYTCWDEKNLYIAAEIKDDVHFQPHNGESVYLGDNIQVAVDTGYQRTEGRCDNDDYIFGLSLTKTGPELFVWAPALNSGILAEGKLSIKREGSYTIYEASIPWTFMKIIPKPGLTMGFSLLVNDNDGIQEGCSGRKGYLQWTSGIGAGKDPGNFGRLILMKD